MSIAKEAEFFSFGTNDLTQMTFGFSRDDAGKFLGAYYDKKIYESDPFAKLDQAGVGKLVEMACKLGRRPARICIWASAASTAAIPPPWSSATRPGLDYVSCSPFRSPCLSPAVFLLAAAQAAAMIKAPTALTAAALTSAASRLRISRPVTTAAC
jgi:pyruvate,orthophosphate dikinase